MSADRAFQHTAEWVTVFRGMLAFRFAFLQFLRRLIGFSADDGRIAVFHIILCLFASVSLFGKGQAFGGVALLEQAVTHIPLVV